MKRLIVGLVKWFTDILKAWILKRIDTKELVFVERSISKGINLAWVELDNVVRIRNAYRVPYILKEVKLTFYNDSGQNIGYLNYQEAVEIKGKEARQVIMTSKLSNVTALFNVARFLLVDHIKMRAVGYSLIKVLWFHLRIPMDDIMVIHKGQIQYGTDEQIARRKARREAMREKRRQQRAEKEALRTARSREKEGPIDQAPPSGKEHLPGVPPDSNPAIPRAAGSSGPVRDRSCPDQ